MSSPEGTPHQPVLLTEVLELLVTDKHGRYVDCTLGMGGHTAALLQALSPSGKVLSLDADPEAVAIAGNRLSAYKGAVTIVRSNFRDVGAVMDHQGFAPAAGALLDLGLSSYQLDKGTRGLSFSTEAPLDMRLDPAQSVTAADILNEWPEEDLEKMLEEAGERNARRLARAIGTRRSQFPFKTTRDLNDIAARYAGRGRLDPATLLFMALRMAVNKDLENLSEALAALKTRILPGGRIGVISFQSLEDRVVKQTFRAWKQEGGWTIITPKPLIPSPEETAQNPRARSAKLRVVERQQPQGGVR